MRLLRRASLVTIGLGAIAFACDSFSGDSPPAKDGVDASVEASASDVTVNETPDASSTPGAFVSEVHGDPGILNLDVPFGLGSSNAGWAYAGWMHAPATIGPAAYDESGVGVLALGHTGALLTKSVIGIAEDITVEGTAIDSSGDIYVVGTRTGSSPTNSKAAFVRKLKGDTGAVIWATSYAVQDGDANAPDYTSTALAVATNGLDVAVAIRFNLLLPFTMFDNQVASFKQLSPPTAEDTAVLFLDGADGKVLWRKQIGGAGAQIPSSIEIADDGSVLVAGQSNLGGIFVDTKMEIPVGSVTSVTAPFFLRFAKAEPHEVTFARALEVLPQGGYDPAFSAHSMPNGDVVACGVTRGTTSLGGVAVTNAGGDDGWAARIGPVGMDWFHTFGGSRADDCTGVAVDSRERISLSLNHASDKVSFAGHALADPIDAAGSAAALLKLDSAGQFLWAYDVVGNGARISHVANAPNDTTLFAGFFYGSVDLGAGPIAAPDASSSEATLFISRRGP